MATTDAAATVTVADAPPTSPPKGAIKSEHGTLVIHEEKTNDPAPKRHKSDTMSPKDKYYDNVMEACSTIKRLVAQKYDDFSIFRMATVLGSGLGAFADELENKVIIPYHDIPGFPLPRVAGHAGRMVVGFVGKRPIIVMQGRVHYYEGYTLQEVVFPIRVLGKLGIELIVMTNAAGGVNFDFKVGDIMIITDQINNLWGNPLFGNNDPRFGPRFPDMSDAYTKRLRPYLRSAGRAMGETLQEGVYCSNMGPTYETPAEVRMMRAWGADAVGMSTIPECIAANHMGVDVVGMSLITNAACGVTDAPLNHKEVQETGRKRAAVLKILLAQWIQTLALMTGSEVDVVPYGELNGETISGIAAKKEKGSAALCIIVSDVPGLEEQRLACLRSGEYSTELTDTLRSVATRCFPGCASLEFSTVDHRFASGGNLEFKPSKVARVCAAPAFPSSTREGNYLSESQTAGYRVMFGDISYSLKGLPANCAAVFGGPDSLLGASTCGIESGPSECLAFAVEHTGRPADVQKDSAAEKKQDV